jgi:hypothetical protein
MKTGSGIQVILRSLPQQSERLQCWYYYCEGFMMYAIEMTSDGMMIPSFMTINSGIQVILKVLPQQFEAVVFGTTDEWNFLCTPLRWPQVA